MLDNLTRPLLSSAPWDRQIPMLKLQPDRHQELQLANVPFSITVGTYTIRTANSTRDLRKALRVRKQVFHYEFARRLFYYFGSDLDHYDQLADHLLIVDDTTEEVVGVYRLICSKFSDEFYSSTEFDISSIRALGGIKLELSRACIAPNHRNGQVINLLWRGIAHYTRLTNARYLFGLSSIATMDTRHIRAIHNYLVSSNHISGELCVDANPLFKLPPDVLKTRTDDEPSPVELPSLFNLYLKAGAKVCSHPVIDTKMKCTDWLTLLDFENLSPAFARRYRQS